MEQKELTILEETLKELRARVLDDENIKGVFLETYPDLDFEETIEETILEIKEYAEENNLDVLNLSLEGLILFFERIIESEEEDSGDDYYGKA
jgi:hypothetical protein